MLLQDLDNQTLIGELRPGNLRPRFCFLLAKTVLNIRWFTLISGLGLLKTAGLGTTPRGGAELQKG